MFLKSLVMHIQFIVKLLDLRLNALFQVVLDLLELALLALTGLGQLINDTRSALRQVTIELFAGLINLFD